MTNAPYPITIGSCSDIVPVNCDVSMADTLQEASDTLDAALAILLSETTECRTARLFGAVTLVQLAKGMTDATITRVEAADDLEARHE